MIWLILFVPPVGIALLCSLLCPYLGDDDAAACLFLILSILWIICAPGFMMAEEEKEKERKAFERRQIDATSEKCRCAYCGMMIAEGSAATYEHGIRKYPSSGRYCCSNCEQFIDGFWEYKDASDYIESDFHYYIYSKGIPHPKLTTQITCPFCGPVHVDRFKYESEGRSTCPECHRKLVRRDAR